MQVFLCFFLYSQVWAKLTFCRIDIKRWQHTQKPDRVAGSCSLHKVITCNTSFVAEAALNLRQLASRSFWSLPFSVAFPFLVILFPFHLSTLHSVPCRLLLLFYTALHFHTYRCTRTSITAARHAGTRLAHVLTSVITVSPEFPPCCTKSCYFLALQMLSLVCGHRSLRFCRFL